MSDPGFEGDDAPHIDFLTPAMQKLAEGCSLGEFCDWFAQHFAGALPSLGQGPGPERSADEVRRMLVAMARLIWQRTPDPAEGWRQRGLAQPSRNDPCYCGSGRKFKHCCQALVANVPPMVLDSTPLGGALLIAGPAAQREPAALRRVPPDMVAAAARELQEEQGPQAVLELLEPLFLQPRGLSARHELSFDLLVEAMLDLGLEARREQLVRVVVAEASDRVLRCAARCRLASFLSDQGRFEQAWEQFRAAQREDGGNLQLLHLELVMLLSQGRLDEARTRAPLLAARARKLGYPELADALLEVEAAGPEGLDTLAGGDFDEDDDAFDEDGDPFQDGDEGTFEADAEDEWIDLLCTPLPHLDAQAFAQLHDVSLQDDADGPVLQVVPSTQVERELAPWSDRFGPALPVLTSLRGEAEVLLGDPPQAVRWLRAHPHLCAAVPVLDDLLVAAREMCEMSGAPEVAAAALELAGAAADMVVAACARWPDAQIPWGNMANRPLLRIVAQAIDFALEAEAGQRAKIWMRWMLARNPEDKHGWREVLRMMLLREGDAQAALAVFDAYPQDAPPSAHERALALYMLGRREEAEAVLRAAHERFPAFVAGLLPQELERPAGMRRGMVTVGGADQAWEWRMSVRDVWESSGALEWLRELQLPLPPAPWPRSRRGRRRR